jgi:hypothetical protein
VSRADVWIESVNEWKPKETNLEYSTTKLTAHAHVLVLRRLLLPSLHEQRACRKWFRAFQLLLNLQKSKLPRLVIRTKLCVCLVVHMFDVSLCVW